MAQIKPFKISVPESQIQDLKQRLALARFPDELADSTWDLGCPLSEIKSLTAYWKDKFDWRAAESRLNHFPQYTTKIKCDGFEPLNIHFVHKRSKHPGAIPLLFVHGWPGSFLEVAKIIDGLVDGGSVQPSFDVVAPSLVGYGFSEGAHRKGFGIEQHARTYHELMFQLGYDEYVTQGGDWGHSITRAIAHLFPSHCKANHLNMDNGSKPTWTSHPLLALRQSLTPFSQHELNGLKRSRWFRYEGSGYFQEHSTKPQTIGYALSDSPAALLAWIFEKLVTWTDSYPWTSEEVCTWISIYWFSTAGPAASVRLYWEAQHPPKGSLTRAQLMGWIPTVKVGLSHFPQELRVLPSSWTRTQGPVVFEKTHSSGGHFAAFEKPNLIVDDVRVMFGRGGGAYKCVTGRDGYGTQERAKL